MRRDREDDICRGVARAIENIRKELDVTMALTGVRSVEEIDSRVLVSSRD